MSNDDPKYPQVLDSNQCQIDAMLYPNNKDVHEVTALKILVSSRKLNSIFALDLSFNTLI